jgi:hypothetical protein
MLPLGPITSIGGPFGPPSRRLITGLALGRPNIIN